MDIDAIERRALEVLATCPRYVWNPQSPPVPVEQIVDTCHGLFVRDVEPDLMRAAPGAPTLAEGQTLSGLLLPSQGEIWVNADEASQWPGRRRFTISHELGHHLLHNSGQQSLFCRRGSVDEEQGAGAAPRPELPEAEREANAFAAALLLPAPWIRHYYERFEGDFDVLCKRFGCSGGAMGRRLHAVIN